MRTLFLLRGAPGSGKSTWIEKNGLTPYTLSADSIRQMTAGLVYGLDGERYISQEHDNFVWKFLLERLEDRMDRGEFVVVDATHYRAALLQQYKKLISQYRYRAYVIDFTDVPEEVALTRNATRESYKKVPEPVIRKMYRVFESDRKEVSNRFTILSPTEAINLLQKSMLFDYNQYQKVYVFGDIHGCFAPLKAFFDEHPFDTNTAYIFTGDYTDRGIQNKEVLEFLLSIYENKNVLLLEGNHERWLRIYANGEPKEIPNEIKEAVKNYLPKNIWGSLEKGRIRNKGFRIKTIPEIQDIPKKEIKKLCSRFGQMAYISFAGKNYFISHGGCPMLPTLFVPTEDLIDGTGRYEDVDPVYDNWEINRGKDDILVHAHRNVFKYETKISDTIYNLCEDIEYGGNLRVLEITPESTNVLLYKNDVFDTNLVREKEEKNIIRKNLSGNELLKELNVSPLVLRKELSDGIVSYNFTRRAFKDSKWNQLTVTARGLFVKDDKVVARSYDKFFNWNENDTVTTRALQEKLVFPVVAYEKENGFLAIISHFNGKLAVYSKSTNKGEFADYIRDALARLSETTRDKMLKYAIEHDVSFVFECIDPVNDPHIVRYRDNHLVLLDVIKNDLKMERLPYNGLRALANDIGLECKKHCHTFCNWKDLSNYIAKENAKTDFSKSFYEGVVFEDTNGFMVKFKTTAYRWWKRNRSILQKVQHGHDINVVYATEQDVKFFTLLDKIQKEGRINNVNIIDIETEFGVYD